jgi:hypothetical protein
MRGVGYPTAGAGSFLLNLSKLSNELEVIMRELLWIFVAQTQGLSSPHRQPHEADQGPLRVPPGESNVSLFGAAIVALAGIIPAVALLTWVL